MLGREVVEGQQLIAIFDQALDYLLVFDAPDLDEDIERRERILLGLGHPDLLQRPLSFSVAGSSVTCSAHWRSCAPSNVGHGSVTLCEERAARSTSRSSRLPHLEPNRL
jgi:hypothetical protein